MEEADEVVAAGVPCEARPEPLTWGLCDCRARSWARQGSAAGYDGREATVEPLKPSPDCCPGQATDGGENRGS